MRDNVVSQFTVEQVEESKEENVADGSNDGKKESISENYK